MWAAICAFFGLLFDNIGKALAAIFSFLKSERAGNKADFDAVISTQNAIIAHQTVVIKSMESRIDVMDGEFKKAMERSDTVIERLSGRVAEQEKESDECRKRLGAALSQVAELRGKLKVLLGEKEQADRIRGLKEDQGYRDRSISHVTELIKEHEKTTKVEDR